MRKLVIPAFLALSFSSTALAQSLFTYGPHEVDKEEFLRVYTKNSFNKKVDMSEAALKEYLDLYSLFKMKVAEANRLQLDTIQSINDELLNYRKQVAKTYLTDDALSAKLVKEAYARMKEEVRVAHILLMMPRGGTPSDTMAVKKKIDSLYNLLQSGKAKFETIAAEHSEDLGSKDLGGDIGYITSLQTVYPFEQMAYKTKKGNISEPFRSQFGYHIVKVLDRRPSQGEVEVRQILITTPESKGEFGKAEAQKKVDTILAELKKGVAFEKLVQRYSEDRFSKDNEGLLPAFGTGKMVPEFEKAAFSLNKVGEVSEPVHTEYGVHLLKLVRKIPLQPFDSLQASLKRRVENDSRSLSAKEAYMAKVKQDNGWKEYPNVLDEMMTRINSLPDTGTQAGVFEVNLFKGLNKPMFAIGGKEYSQDDFGFYLHQLTRGRVYGPREAVVKDVYKMYQENVVNDYLEQKLVETNKDFRLLMNDYRDGIMLFELMDKQIWTAAAQDSTGLEQYYRTHQSKYQWEPGFKGVVYTLKGEQAVKDAQSALSKKGTSAEQVMQSVNNEAHPEAGNYRTGYFEYSKYPAFTPARLAEGKVSETFRNEDGTFSIVVPEKIYPNGTSKTLDEARGFVISEYQEQLEKEWNTALKKKYPVKVNDKIFRSMVKN